MNKVIEVIKNRRAIRDYLDKEISEEDIKTIIEAGTYAPSGMNNQPWKFIIITYKSKMKEYSDKVKPFLLKKLPEINDPKFKMFKSRLEDNNFNIFYNAPLLIFVVGDTAGYSTSEECAMAAENMMLAAKSLGIGSCWIGSAMPLAQDKDVIKELGIPENHKIIAPLIFGYPKEEIKTSERKEAIIIKNLKPS